MAINGVMHLADMLIEELEGIGQRRPCHALKGFGEYLDGKLRGHFAVAMAAHAVGQHGQ